MLIFQNTRKTSSSLDAQISERLQSHQIMSQMNKGYGEIMKQKVSQYLFIDKDQEDTRIDRQRQDQRKYRQKEYLEALNAQIKANK